MRDPAMHIRLSDFVGILSSNGIPNPQQLALRIFEQAVPLNIRGRYHISGDAKTQRQLKKAVTSSNSSNMTVEKFNRILDAERRTAGHRHLSPIRKGTTNWTMLKDVAVMAIEFSESVGIANVDEGCKLYIQVGLELMKKSNQYALGKFKYYDDKIYKLYESYDLIATDPNPERTKEFADTYAVILMETAGISRDLSKPQDYVCFLLAREEADKVKADADDWIRAQFEEIDKAFGSLPNPNQLFSEWATKRYYQYLQIPKAQQGEELVITSRNTSKDDFMSAYEAKVKTLANKISTK